jgi:uncharacterized membrane protein
MHLLTDVARGSLATVVIAFVLIFAGVVLPTVWSRRRGQRGAAVVVLRQILQRLSGVPGHGCLSIS